MKLRILAIFIVMCISLTLFGCVVEEPSSQNPPDNTDDPRKEYTLITPPTVAPNHAVPFNTDTSVIDTSDGSVWIRAYNTGYVFKLSESDADKFRAVLNDLEWLNDGTKCCFEGEIYYDDICVRYCFYNGVIQTMDNERAARIENGWEELQAILVEYNQYIEDGYSYADAVAYANQIGGAIFVNFILYCISEDVHDRFLVEFDTESWEIIKITEYKTAINHDEDINKVEKGMSVYDVMNIYGAPFSDNIVVSKHPHFAYRTEEKNILRIYLDDQLRVVDAEVTEE